MTRLLVDIATIIRGVTFDKNEAIDDAAPGHLPVLRAGNIGIDLMVDRDLVWVPESRIANEQRMQVNDIAICMSSGSQSVVGKSATLKAPWQGSVGAFCALIRPRSEQVVPEYLSLFLQSEVFRQWTRQSSGANIKNIRKSELESFPIALPSVAEQRRIVDLLTRAEGIVRLRREAAAKAAELIPAIFIDMFGDPAINPKGWPVVALGDLLAEPPTLGTMKKPTLEPQPWLDLRVANIQGGQLRLEDKKWLDLTSDEVGRFELRADDIILARAIGSLDHLGKAVVVNPDGPWTFDSHLMRVRVNQSRLLPKVLTTFLETASGRREFLSRTRRSAVQFNINGKELRLLKLPLPPVDLQAVFAQRFEEVSSIARQQTDALAKAQATFNALLAQAFASPASSASTQE